ncbi:MAG: RNA polymerase I enhancer binding protein [Vezdaea aestivalis]|nr:MAG: RNA polymerase I enhancer binding protein [Vezdaea aestivalis]
MPKNGGRKSRRRRRAEKSTQPGDGSSLSSLVIDPDLDQGSLAVSSSGINPPVSPPLVVDQTQEQGRVNISKYNLYNTSPRRLRSQTKRSIKTMGADDNTKEEASARALLEMKGFHATVSPLGVDAYSPRLSQSSTRPDMRNSLAKILNNPMPSFSNSTSHKPPHVIDTRRTSYSSSCRDSGLVTPDEPDDSEFNSRIEHSLSRSKFPMDVDMLSGITGRRAASSSTRLQAIRPPVICRPSEVQTPPYGPLDSPPETARLTAPPQFLQDPLADNMAFTDGNTKRRKFSHNSPGYEDLIAMESPHPHTPIILPALTRAIQPSPQQSPQQTVQLQHGWSAIVDRLPTEKSQKGRSKRKRDNEVEQNQPELQPWDYQSQQPSEASTPGSPSSKDVSGVFQKHEIEALTVFMQEYCQTHFISQYDLNSRIQETNRSAHNRFWDEVTKVLPHRKRQSVYKVCRRRFHNFGVRGKWTAKEDEALKNAQAAKPNQWKAIGEMINRMPEDCRDRWRNYLKCGDNRQQDVWTEQEEILLRNAVKKCFKKLKTDPSFSKRSGASSGVKRDFSMDNDKNLNWTFISEEINGVRSRLQCQYKWPKLKRRDEENERLRAETSERLARGLPAEDDTKKTWRAKRAELNYAKMLPGDKMDIIVLLLETATIEEQNIPWKLIGKSTICSKDTWTIADCKTAYRKMKEEVQLLSQANTLGDILALIQDHLTVHHSTQLHDRFVHPAPRPRKNSAEASEDLTSISNDSDDSDLRYINEELEQHMAPLAQS